MAAGACLSIITACAARDRATSLCADSLREANFRRADAEFSFPYGFKHGTILKITDEEYERIRSFDFAEAEQGSPC